MKILGLVTFIFCFSIAAFADIDGKFSYQPKQCDGLFSGAKSFCKLINSAGVGASCDVTQDTCADVGQELFLGVSTELGKPADFNVKKWTGFGALALPYQQANLCLLRDIKDAPLNTSVSASTPLGSISFDQTVQFLKFDKQNFEWTGYHRGKACLPVVGCLDIFTQKMTAKAVWSDLKNQSHFAGEYKMLFSHGLEMGSDGLQQKFKAAINAIKVVTPYGVVSATPEFGFGRTLGMNIAPFSGNSTLSLFKGSDFGAAKMTDIYGRNPGIEVCKKNPEFYNFSSSAIDLNPIGYFSQVTFGSRTSNPNEAVWKPQAGATFSERPDFKLNQPRKDLEKAPNGYMGADVKVSYSPTDLIPEFIRNSSFISTAFDVWAKPMIQAAFSSQFFLLNYEIAKGTKLATPNGPLLPFINYRDQFKGFTYTAASTATARTALEAGVNLTLHLHIPLVIFDDIDIDLIDIHPSVVVAEKIATGSDQEKKVAFANSQISKIQPDGGKVFRHYISPTGLVNEDKANAHIQACLSSPTIENSPPADPVYQPGNPTDLTKGIQYPCNICIGWNAVKYEDDNHFSQQFDGYLGLLQPVDQSPKPTNVRWSCDNVGKSGCHDMCNFDVANGTLSVAETAVEIQLAGKASKMPLRCK